MQSALAGNKALETLVVEGRKCYFALICCDKVVDSTRSNSFLGEYCLNIFLLLINSDC